MTPPTTIEFSGIDARDDAGTFPAWYRDVTDAQANADATFPSFGDAIKPPRSGGALPTAEKTRVAYRDTDADAWVEDDDHVALVNPEWLGESSGPSNAAWHIPTDSYTIVNPLEMYGPLVAMVRQARATDDGPDLGDVYGQLRLYRLGGEVHLDILFDGCRVADPGTPDDPFVLGIQSGYDFFGGRTLYAEAVAYDTRTGTAMRGLTDKRTRRHVGSAGQTVAAWWAAVLETLETAADTLFEVVAEARNYVVDFADYPFDVQEFYELLGFPEYLADHADQRVGVGIRRADAWTLYHAAAQTLTDEFDGKDDGAALTRYVRAANRILYTPPRAEADACAAKERALRAQESLTADDESAAEALATKRETAEQSVGAFTTTRGRLRTLLTEADA